MAKIFDIGDVIKVHDSSGYYRAHSKRATPNILVKSESIDDFPKEEEVTVIGFQVLNGDDKCVILRKNRKCYWMSLNILGRSKGKYHMYTLIKRTNKRKKKDILKRYWGKKNG